MTDLDSAKENVVRAQAAHTEATEISSTINQPWSQELVILLAAGIICFSVITLFLAAVLLWRSNTRPHNILRVFGILTIVSLSTLLMVVGYSDQQLTPIIGLFGAVAGYLLSSRANFAVKAKLAVQQRLSDEALGVDRGRTAHTA